MYTIYGYAAFKKKKINKNLSQQRPFISNMLKSKFSVTYTDILPIQNFQESIIYIFCSRGLQRELPQTRRAGPSQVILAFTARKLKPTTI